MSKKLQFQLLGQLVNHPDFPDAKPGDILKLEVGDDNLPTSDLLRSRTMPVGASLEAGDGLTEKEAKGKAKEIIEDAKAKAAAILDKANADAAELIAAAGQK